MKAYDQLFKRVLLIDDDATTNAVNGRMILNSGLAEKVDAVSSAPAAIKYLQTMSQEESQEPIDLILVDLKMDGHDGYWFLEQYARKKAIRKARVVAALTSSASFYDLERLKTYNDVAMHVFKPLTSEHLKTLRNHM